MSKQPSQDRPNVQRTANAVAAGGADPVKELSTFLRGMEPQLAVGIYKGLSTARMIDIVCAAASRQPDLAKCTPLSIYRALKQAAQLGLEPMTVQRHAYLVPFKNNRKTDKGWQTTVEAQLIVGYQGLCELALRHERVKAVRAAVVYEGERCEITLEPPSVRHEWKWDGADREERKILGAYAIAELSTGSIALDVMTKSEIDGIRARSKANGLKPNDDGKAPAVPWNTDYAAMARKTVIRRLLQRGSVPMSSDLSMVAEQDDDQEEIKDARVIVRDAIGEAKPAEPAASESELVDIPMDVEPRDQQPRSESKQPTQAEAAEKLLSLAKGCGVDLKQVLTVASRDAGKTVASVEELRALPVDTLLDMVDRLEAQIERQEAAKQ